VTIGVANFDGMAADASPSIYDRRPRALKNAILAAAACTSILVPATDTIYLPALDSVRKSLGGTIDEVAASVSVYMAMVGVFSLLWGPLSDRYGRRRPLILSLVLYLLSTAACPFSPTMTSLIILRAVEGAVVCASVTVAQGVVADTFAPHERGTALGLFFLPLLVGPIVAPIMGGALSGWQDWRATFYLLLVLGALILPIVCWLPETHHYFAYHVFEAMGGGPGAAAGVGANGGRGEAPPEAEVEADEARPGVAGEADPAAASAEPASASANVPAAAARPAAVPHDEFGLPRMEPPWVPLTFMVEEKLWPFVALSGANFGVMFMALTMLPTFLAAPPYSLSATMIGLCYIPIGLTMMAGSICGGILSDRAGAAAPGVVAARLVPSILGSLALPVGCLVFGFVLHQGGSLAVVLILGHSLIGFGQAVYMAGFMAYLTTVKGRQASGASAGSMTINFVIAAMLISAAPPLFLALGTHGLFALSAGLHLAVTANAGFAQRRIYAAGVAEASAASAASAQDSKLAAVAAAL
jgi:multidrug resistance protein